MSETIRIHVGPATCDHRWEIANAVARHDFPGMPSLAELAEDQQQAYLDFADQVLSMPFQARTP